MPAQSVSYVDQSAAPGGDGSQAAPFQTIGEAAAVTVATIWVAPGVYAEHVVLPPGISLIGAEGPTETIIQAVSDGPVLCAAGLSAYIEGFTILGSPDLTTTGLDGTASYLDAFVNECVFVGHEQALATWWPVSTLTHLVSCTFADNDVIYSEGPGGILNATRTIFSGGTVGEGSFSLDGCFVQQGIGLNVPLSNNSILGADPAFWKAPEDVHLRPGSPCIGVLPGQDIGALPYDPAYAPAPVTFCTSKTSSQGCAPTIGHGGGPASDSSPLPFLVRANGVDEAKNGHLFFGLAPGPFPFLGGWHCVQPPTQRTPIQNSGSAGGACSGSFALDFNAFVQGGGTPHVVPGTMVTAQYWYRDPNDPFGSMLTDAIEFGYGL